MSTGEALLWWDGARAGFRPAGFRAAGFRAAGERGEIRVIDSWLVADGRVRAFDAHERRFGRACAALAGVDRERTREFMRAAIARVPAAGRWFPRAELADVDGVDGNPRLRLRIRPAPPRGHSVRLWISPSADARTNPAVKGPDLDWLAAQRKAAVAAGADEAVLLSPDGRVREGSTASILWWRGDTLCAPPADGHLLPSVTRELLLRAVEAAGYPVSISSAEPAGLGGLEVWTVNALHGIRPVTAWAGTGIVAGPAQRAPRWQAYLDGLSREVRPGPARAAR
jgi:branched-subunit amino acid aminotransferase/4-amino-4-deoxychorismate lyase